MAVYSDVTKRSVLAAIREYDALGQEAFLDKYERGPSTKYMLVHDGKQYDSKAILGVACKFEHPDREVPPHDAFSGGRNTVVAHLQGLGFDVRDVTKNSGAGSSLGSPVPRVVLQPASSAAPQENYRKTIKSPVPLERIRPHVTDDVFKRLKSIYLTGEARVWAASDGTRNRSIVEEMEPGDLVLFYAQGRFFSVVDVTLTDLDNDSLGRELWGTASTGETWPHIFFLSEPRTIDISYGDLHSIANYGPADALRGLTLLPPESGRAVREAFDLQESRARQQAVWWVNQGKTYHIERDGGYIWAPQQAKNGATFGHHEAVNDVRKDDVLLHYAKGAVRAIGRSTAPGASGIRPDGLPDEPWGREGYIADVQYWELEDPIELGEIPSSLRTSADGPFDVNGAVKQGYLFPLEDDVAMNIRTRFADRWPNGSPWGNTSPGERHDMNWLEEKTLWDRERLEELTSALLGDSPQVVLAGPPGTSKTWVAMHVAQYLTNGNESSLRVVQFHPSYGYEEFIEGLRPISEDGSISFERVDGVVKSMAGGMTGPEDLAVLVIDEMNRGNLPRIFGELMYLFEYRNRSIDLQYSSDFSLPAGLKFIGTMNTADRSIRSIDIALRRRFDVFECPPSRVVLERFYERAENRNQLGEGLYEGFEELNARLQADLDRHHTIGHTFFMYRLMNNERLSAVWDRKLRPLIEEYFFDQEDLAAEYSLAEFWPGA